MATLALFACSPHPAGTTDILAERLIHFLQKGTTEIDLIHIRDYTIQPCTGCGYCSIHPGKCVLENSTTKTGGHDDTADLFVRLLRADALLFTIPVYFYGPPAFFKGFIDRAQKFWFLPREEKILFSCKRRPAWCVLCGARIEGKRLFEANLLILRCFLSVFGFSLQEPLLLRGLEGPADLNDHAEYSRQLQDLAQRINGKTAFVPAGPAATEL